MDDPNSDFEIVNEDIEIKLKEIGHMLGNHMPPGWGFSFLMFNFGEGGATFYISNAQRADMIKAMKEFIEKQEGKNHAK